MPFLLKSEPEKYSFDDLLRDGETTWDGIKNPQALLNLRNMKKGDKLVLYHSNTGKAAVGTAKVVSNSTDPANPRNPVVRIAATEKACPLLVPLVEEGWIDHPVTRQVARIYLSEALRESPSLTTLLLGCTHYPLLRPLLEQTLADLGHPLRIIDSAQATAHTVAACLEPGSEAASPPPACTFYATDSIEKFQQLGSHFLGQPLPEVHLVDLGG